MEQDRTRPDPVYVVEVVLAVGFSCLPSKASMHFASFWDANLSEEFPRVEEQAPYFSSEDPAHADQASGPHGLSGAFGGADSTDSPVHRLWFVNDGADVLLQLQRNWFAANWRPATSESRRLGWPHRRDRFIDWLSGLDAHLAGSEVGHLAVRHYEVNYVGHLHAGRCWKHHGEFDKVFRSLGPDDHPSYLRRERVRFEQDFLVMDAAGMPEARQLVKVRPGYAATGRTPVYVLEAQVRSVPRPRRIETIGGSLDLAHDAILDAMAAVTISGPPDEPDTGGGPSAHVVRRPREMDG